MIGRIKGVFYAFSQRDDDRKPTTDDWSRGIDRPSVDYRTRQIRQTAGRRRAKPEVGGAMWKPNATCRPAYRSQWMLGIESAVHCGMIQQLNLFQRWHRSAGRYKIGKNLFELQRVIRTMPSTLCMQWRSLFHHDNIMFATLHRATMILILSADKFRFAFFHWKANVYPVISCYFSHVIK